MMKKLVLVSLAVALAAGAQAKVKAAAPASFAQCGVCHAVSKGAANGIGPNLYGIFGKKSGVVAGFNYSPALKAGKVTWDAASLDKWIAGPAAFVPGSRMPFAGLSDAKKRTEVVAYLKTLK